MFYVKNLSGLERFLRVLAGVIATALAVLYLDGLAMYGVAISAAIAVVSGLFGFCPACAMVGRRFNK
jgi:hypothetical protein